MAAAIVRVGCTVIGAAGRICAARDDIHEVSITIVIRLGIGAVSRFFRRTGFVVAGGVIRASGNFCVVANAIPVVVRRAVSSAIAEGIEVLAAAIVRVGCTVIGAAGRIGAARHVRVEQVLIHVTDVIPIEVFTGLDRTAIQTEGVHLLGAEIATARTEFVPIAVRQRVPTRGEIVHSIAEEVFDDELVTPIHRTEVLGNEAASVGAVVVVATVRDDGAIRGVDDFPADAEGEGVELHLQGQIGAGEHAECAGDRVVDRLAIAIRDGEQRQFVVSLWGGKPRQGQFHGGPGGEVARPAHDIDRTTVQGEMNVSGCDGVAAEVLKGHEGLDGGGTTRGGQSFDGGDAHIHRADRNEGFTVQQAGTVRHESIPHPRALSLREGIHARVVGVIHEVLDHRLRTLDRRAADGTRGRRGVADPVPLAAAIRLRTTGRRGIEGVQQAEVVAHFVGQGAVEIVVEDQVKFFAHAKDLVVDHDAIVHARGGRQVGKAEGRESAIHAGEHPDVDVLVSRPMAQRFDVHFRSGVAGERRDHARAGKTGNHLGHIDAVDARGGLPIGIPHGQCELNVDVRSAKGALEIRIQGIDGADDLGFGNVGARSDVVSVVHDVHHHGKGVGLARPVGAGCHFCDGRLECEVAPGEGRVRQLSGVHRV